MDKKIAIFCLCALIAIFVIPTVLRAASFDCSKATTKTEKAICGDPTLSKLDEDMAAAYSKALKTSDPEAAKKGQRKWLKEVLAPCIEDKVCIKKAYENRLRQLEFSAAQSSPASKGGSSSERETVVEEKVGLFPVQVGGKRGYIDKTGKIVIKPEFAGGGDFHEGLAVVGIGDKYGYIDKTGNFVIKPQFDDAWGFHEGLAKVKIVGKWAFGFIDKTGKFVIKPEFTDGVYAGSFQEGLAAVSNGSKWGFIDKTGNFVIKPQFDAVWDFQEGLAPVESGGKWGYIDKTGKVVIKPQFDFAQDFQEGLARVEIGGKWGFIDKAGNFVIKPQFDFAQDFQEGLAKVSIGKKRGYIGDGYIDKTGRYIWNPTR